MAEPERAVPAVRIERGRAGAEELAALTVVLLIQQQQTEANRPPAPGDRRAAAERGRSV
ncbi:acyl-CoA carboxylase epsilon subunit, partial [Streptomyces sp. NPDC055506]